MKKILFLLCILLCINSYAQYRWAYMAGSKFGSQTPRYTAGFLQPVQPGSRINFASYWADRNSGGQMWFFGGQGIVSGGAFGFSNELWRLNPDGAAVTFMGGTQTANSAGTYTGLSPWPSSRTYGLRR